MSLLSSMFGNSPGLTIAVETFEQAWSWGPQGSLIWTPGYISSSAADPTNSPTTNLRPGLVMGIVTSTGAWENYDPTATDGTQIARGVLPIGLTMNDFITGSNQAKAFGIVVGGRVQGSKLVGLDLLARSQMAQRFTFDDDVIGNRLVWNKFLTKTAAYTVVAADNGTLFDNTGASGSVTFTLPAIARGYIYGFRVVADQTIVVASAEGTNMLAFNNASASSVAFQTGGQKIGGMFMIYSDIAGSKWIVNNLSAGTNTVTVA